MEQPTPPQRALARGVAPPRRIELGDLLLRRWETTDFEAQFAALTASFDQLHAWMPWMAHAPSRDRQREFLAKASADWPDSTGECAYGIFDSEDGVLGAIGLGDHLGPKALEIGYWCHSAHTGRGLITRSVAALTDIALALPDIGHVEIHCDVANTRSAAVPRRLGYRLDRVEPRERLAPAHSGNGMVWVRDTPLNGM
ncbi:GNAT family N-acetyltransferase [Nocardia noduli]|uniref:GNAT family N-acetyltransferase n=1 Tax=Nocardia noduli TaxID=2815722 RepID=UPI001C22E46E|nr:GNAT family N-acetyltransferase [Nocardia noduli]